MEAGLVSLLGAVAAGWLARELLAPASASAGPLEPPASLRFSLLVLSKLSVFQGRFK